MKEMFVCAWFDVQSGITASQKKTSVVSAEFHLLNSGVPAKQPG